MKEIFSQLSNKLNRQNFGSNYLKLLLICLTFSQAQLPLDINYPELWETVVYEGNVLNDKSFGYYQLTISERYFNSTQALAIKVIPEQFDSDPDLFISKVLQNVNMLQNFSTPTNSDNSQWFCVKSGGDTCIIGVNDITIGDTFIIGVRCINPCQYTISTSYVPVVSIKDANRTQLRLDGYSSTILEYLVPSTNKNGITRAVYLQIESENQYNPIDLYFSLDSTIYQVEERKVEDILDNGVGFAFTENDYGWCTGCYIYFLVEVRNDGRYYATFTPSPRDSTLAVSTKTQVMTNIRQQECLLYFVQGADNDVILYSRGYQGDTDFYISGSTRPSDNQDNKRILQMAQRVPQKAIIITAEDRARWGFKTGVMNLCMFAFDTASTQLLANEDNYGGRFDALDGISYTFNIEKNSSMYFRYTQSTFTSQGNISVSITSYNLSNGQPPPRVFFKVCPSSDYLQCSLSDTEVRGVGMTELASGNNNITNSNTRAAIIRHNPQNCQNPSSCFYLISVFFADQNGPMKTSFVVTYNVTITDPVTVDKEYQNILQQGQYFYYALYPGSSIGFQYLKSLTIKIESLIGDADLVVSVVDPNPEVDQNQFEARGSCRFDALTLNKTGNFSLNRPIYIGVFATTYCIYKLNFVPIYELEYNSFLTKAISVRDSIAYYNYYTNEFQESFYSFMPWWAGYENRTIVFFAEVTFNNVFFYMDVNDYPLFYMTNYRDSNDVIVVYPTDPNYSIQNGYYVRTRPDFQLQDLISSRQYIFNFYIFSQLPSTRIVDIHLNEMKFGYTNGTNIYYRHFILENNATYNFSVIPIIGNPALLLKLSNDPIFPNSADVQSWDYKSDNPDKQRDSIVVPFADRSSKYAFCDRAGYNLNAGNRSCGFYLAVECANECIYNITVQIIGREKQALPKYLTEEDYYTGQVGYNNFSYFYYPLSKNQTGEMVVILNKTAPLNQNGDSMLLAILIPQTDQLSIDNWTYPNSSNQKTYSMISANFNPNQPEIIEICSSIISSRCSNGSCILMLGVQGLTQGAMSNFRIIVQKQYNKLYDRNAIKGTISNIGEYDYYWFTCNVSASNPSQFWEYTITASVDSNGQDVDLYISVLDGRYPVTEDYDFASENLGADDIYINSQDSFFDAAGYDKRNGIVFMVGVKAITANVTYTLMMTGPTKQQIQITNLTTGNQQTRGLEGTNPSNNTNYFKWFNWGHKDFRINIDVNLGNVSVFVNFVGEEVFQTNGFQALPQNANSSKWTVYLNATQSGVLRVTKEDIGGNNLFCYYCWYFVTVTTNMTGKTQYRISVNEVPDVGEEVVVIQTNTSSTFTLPATGTVQQRKFILDSKDPFTINANVTTGYLIMYVGLYPNSPKNKFQWKTEGTGSLQIYVRQTDQNFHVGAFYYITLQAGQGRTTFSLALNQRKTVQQLESGIVYKDQYWNMEERIKLYYFIPPTSRTNQFTATLNIQALSEDFYPMVLFYKNTLASTPTDFTKLTYPNFTYTIRETTGTNVYFTIALYSFSYGMTDRRKASFKISLVMTNQTLQGINEEYSLSKYDSLDNMFEPQLKEFQEGQFLVWRGDESTLSQKIEEQNHSLLAKVQEWFQSQAETVESYLSKAKKLVTTSH